MSAYNHNKPPLPENWTPTDRDIVVGKGKKFYLHPGNVMLRNLVASMLADYSKAHTKAGKSEIISDVVENVNKNGAFVKRHPSTGKWVYAEDRLCREKCSQTFRDALHETYRSSSVAKKNKRRREQQETMYCPSASQGVAPSSDALMKGNKRMRIMEPARVAPTSIPSNLFDFDLPITSLSAKAMRRNSLASTGGDNFVSLLTDMLNFPSLQEDDSNPFEPTPLPHSKINPSAVFDIIDAAPGFLGSKFNEADLEFPPLGCESATGNMGFFKVDESREKVPNVAAAFAA